MQSSKTRSQKCTLSFWSVKRRPRARGKTAKRLSKVTWARNSRKPVDLAEIRQQIKNQVGYAASGMVDAGIEEANKGHYATLKFSFKLVGLYPEPAGADEGEGEGGLAKTLAGRLGVLEPAAGPEVTNGCRAVPTSESNTVE